MADTKKSKALELELHQIIQADRMAMDLINGARDTRSSIEKRTADEKAQILQDARQKREEMTKRVEEEHRAALAARKAEAAKAFASQRELVDAEMREHKDAWVQEITASIIEH